MTIPVWVIGGYLGAGKTTLLNTLLRDDGGVRYAVLVNDFGSVNVDAELIAASGTETIELTNGCTCCTIGGDLIVALKELVERAQPPERIVIEASGVADPQAVARLAAAHPALAVEGAIVVVDAETIRTRVHDKYVGGLVRRQLRAADALVLTKTDLIDRHEAAAVRAWLAATVPNVPLLEAAPGEEFPVGLAFDPLFAARRHGDDTAETSPHAAFTAVTFRSPHPLDRARFLTAVAVMQPLVARAKGMVFFAADPAARHVFQMTGKRWSAEPLAGGNPGRETCVVAIAPAAREAELNVVLEALRQAEVVAPVPSRMRE